MNKYLYSLSILVLMTSEQKSQTYVPFPDSNAVWNVSHATGSKSYKIMGDSVYNAITYKKYYAAQGTQSNTLQYTFFALLREDISNKKVFAIPAGTNQERLLYNFNLNLNDTVRVYPLDDFLGSSFKLKVDHIDSVLVNNQFRKQMRMKSNSHWLSEFWIEGVGSTYGIFYPGLSDFWIVDAEVCIELRCFWENGVLSYPQSPFQPCYSPKTNCFTRITVNAKSKDAIKIFPNPALSSLKIELGDISKVKLTIYDVAGCVAVTESISQEKSNLDISELENGFYTVFIEADSLKYFQRIIKQ